MQTWPMQPQLYGLFPECRVIAATKMAMRLMPPLAVLSTLLMYKAAGSDLPQALTIGLFMLSLPMQGLMWLGYRSRQPLPPSLRSWYLDIQVKMRSQGCSTPVVNGQPKYQQLAQLLKNAFSQLDSAFTRQWF